MFKSLNNRQKLSLTLAAFVILLLFSYPLSIKKTVNEIKDYRRDKTLVSTAKGKEKGYSNLQKQMQQLKTLEKKYSMDSALLDRQLLGEINTIMTDLHLNLIEYEPLGINSRHVWTRSITVEGGFIPITKLINELEQQGSNCRVSSVDFYKIKEYGNKENRLNCKIYLQNILKY